MGVAADLEMFNRKIHGKYKEEECAGEPHKYDPLGFHTHSGTFSKVDCKFSDSETSSHYINLFLFCFVFLLTNCSALTLL